MHSVTMDTDEIFELYSSLYEAERRFKSACTQIAVLDARLEDVRVRYDRAVRNNQRPFRMLYRIRIATIQGVRNAYCEYAMEKGTEMARLNSALRSPAW